MLPQFTFWSTSTREHLGTFKKTDMFGPSSMVLSGGNTTTTSHERSGESSETPASTKAGTTGPGHSPSKSNHAGSQYRGSSMLDSQKQDLLYQTPWFSDAHSYRATTGFLGQSTMPISM